MNQFDGEPGGQGVVAETGGRPEGLGKPHVVELFGSIEPAVPPGRAREVDGIDRVGMCQSKAEPAPEAIERVALVHGHCGSSGCRAARAPGSRPRASPGPRRRPAARPGTAASGERPSSPWRGRWIHDFRSRSRRSRVPAGGRGRDRVPRACGWSRRRRRGREGEGAATRSAGWTRTEQPPQFLLGLLEGLDAGAGQPERRRVM